MSRMNCEIILHTCMFTLQQNLKIMLMRGMRKPNAMRNMNHDSEEDRYATIKMPTTWGLVSSLSFILELAEDSGLCEKFWETARPALDYLNQRLGLNDIQLVFLAVMIEEGENMSWRNLGVFFGLSRLQTMIYADDLEDLIEKGWVVRSRVREMGAMKEAFHLEKGVVNAIRHEKPYQPEDLSNMTLQKFLDRVTNHIDIFLRDRGADMESDMDWYRRIINANPDMEVCRLLNSFDSEYDRILLLIAIANYSLFADSDDEGIRFSMVNRVFPDEIETDGIRFKLKNGTHPLLKKEYLEYRNQDGMADTEVYVLHSNIKETLLSDYKPSRILCGKGKTTDRFIQSHKKIQTKTLFYNPFEETQIERLTKLLDSENFVGVQSRLKEKGMRKGFACLFYGTPGTGKTETVLQLARLTGRDIMKVEVAGLRDKFVGESEKNIKSIFTRYRELCKNCERQPILLFNEADAILGKRMESAEHSVDKMNNAMQNIILQEMEELDGIMIATTNLTGNLDPAFERRFLFKIEFKKPGIKAKSLIWESMLEGNISRQDAMTLASEYDFSGGQIENIVRKQTVDYILEGQQATLDNLRRYCDEEQIKDAKKNANAGNPIGFKMHGLKDKFD